jgi:hypothetical protein
VLDAGLAVPAGRRCRHRGASALPDRPPAPRAKAWTLARAGAGARPLALVAAKLAIELWLAVGDRRAIAGQPRPATSRSAPPTPSCAARGRVAELEAGARAERASATAATPAPAGHFRGCGAIAGRPGRRTGGAPTTRSSPSRWATSTCSRATAPRPSGSSGASCAPTPTIGRPGGWRACRPGGGGAGGPQDV